MSIATNNLIFPEGGWSMNQIDSFTCSQSLGYSTSINFETLRKELNVDCQRVSLIHVIYTGGTIGMKKDPIKKTLVPESNYLLKAIKRMGSLHDNTFHTSLDIPNLCVLPLMEDKRVAFILQEYDHLLDSSNCTFDNWINIAKNIKADYENYDGFVILHGTDTLAYASSALSFIMENLSKPVIVTGSQIPICEIRTDGRDNLINSIMMASHDNAIKEVCVFFNKNIIRGCRVVKSSSVHLDAFISPNHPCLADLSIDIKINENLLMNLNPNNQPLEIFTNLNNDVAILRIFPSISDKFIQDFFNSSVKGVVLQCYGAGNVPSMRSDMINAFKDATRRGIIIVNITQCLYGGVKAIYETGAQLLTCGVIPGFDMTTEAALTKLSYVLSKYPDHQLRRKMMCTNIRGEATIPDDFSLTKYDIDDDLEHSLDLTLDKNSELDRIVREFNKYLKINDEWSRKMCASIIITALRDDNPVVLKYIFDCQNDDFNSVVKNLDNKRWSILHYVIFYNAKDCLKVLKYGNEMNNIILRDGLRAIIDTLMSMEYYSCQQIINDIATAMIENTKNLTPYQSEIIKVIRELENDTNMNDETRKKISSFKKIYFLFKPANFSSSIG